MTYSLCTVYFCVKLHVFLFLSVFYFVAHRESLAVPRVIHHNKQKRKEKEQKNKKKKSAVFIYLFITLSLLAALATRWPRTRGAVWVAAAAADVDGWASTWRMIWRRHVEARRRLTDLCLRLRLLLLLLLLLLLSFFLCRCCLCRRLSSSFFCRRNAYYRRGIPNLFIYLYVSMCLCDHSKRSTQRNSQL